MLCMCVSLWAWWEVVAAHHRVQDYACCRLQADCLESGIRSGPLRSTMDTFIPLPFYIKMTFTFAFAFTFAVYLRSGRVGRPALRPNAHPQYNQRLQNLLEALANRKRVGFALLSSSGSVRYVAVMECLINVLAQHFPRK